MVAEIVNEISEFLQKGRAKNVKKLVQDALDQGVDPKEILNDGLLAGMMIVGGKFKRNEVFVPEVLVAARAMSAGVAILEPKLIEVGNEPIGKAVVGTVKGDLHDIGKNLVVLMLKNYGYRVIDLGKDVSAECIIETAVKEHAAIIGLSALMTTTMMRMRDVVELAQAKHCSSKIIIGGAVTTQSFADEIGADGYSRDAAEAVHLVERLLNK